MTPREGIVTAIYEKPWQDVKLFSFKIEDDDTFYRMGREQPDFKKGDTICFEDRNTNATNITVQKTAPTPAAQTPSGTTGMSDVGARMRYQAARSDATRLVVAALQADHLPHATNTPKGKKWDLLRSYVTKVTAELLQEENNYEEISSS